MSTKNKRWWLVVLLPILGVTATAEELLIQDILRNATPVGLNLQGDHVDPRTGDLQVLQNDLTWRGNGGLDIVINRTYSAQQASGNNRSALNNSFRWRQLGPGWGMVVAPRWVDTKPRRTTPGFVPEYDLTNLCGNKKFDGAFEPEITSYLELPDGAQEYMFFVGNYTARSKNNWRAVCNGGNVTVTSPEGISYDFGNISPRETVIDTLYGPFGGSQLLTAKRATDLYGNWLAYSYERKNFGSESVGGYSGDEYGWATLPVSITASDGRQVNFTHDAATGRLTSMSDNAGRTWTYEYSLKDRDMTGRNLTAAILPEGRTWRFAYAAGPMGGGDYRVNALSRKLTAITYPEGGTATYAMEAVKLTPWDSRGDPVYFPRVTGRSSTGGIWSYTYTRGAIGQYDTTVETRPDGVQITYSHMGTGYAHSDDHLVNSNTGWLFGRLMEKSDNRGNKETYTWHQREISPDRRRVVSTELVWDAKTWAADLSSRTIERDGATYLTTYSDFDSYGNPGTIAETGPNGGSRTIARTYNIDPQKWLVSQLKDESYPGNTTSRVFNSNGKPESITQDGVTTSYTYDGEGNLGTITYPRGLVHSYSNYARGVPQYESQPEGITIRRAVDAMGNITAEVNGEGKTTATNYDYLGRPTLITYPIGSTKAFTYGPDWTSSTRGDLVEKTEFDGFGLPLRTSLGGIETAYEYDAFGRKTFQSDPGSSTGTSYTYDHFDRITSITNADQSTATASYGPGSATFTNERNQATTHTYRVYGIPEQSHVISITTSVPAANVVIERNDAGLITSVTQGGVTRGYEYNANNYLVGVRNPETGKTVLGRDIAGNMTSRAVGTQAATTFAYDGQNRLSAISYPDSTPAVSRAYTKTGKLKAVATAAVSRSYDYDDNDNLTRETQTIDGAALSVGYGYNTIDQLSTIVYPHANHVVEYAPDALGRPTKVSGYINSVSYWPSGQISELVYGNGVVTSYRQSPRLWPLSFSTLKGGVYFIDNSYTYDGAGNLTSIGDTVDGAYSRTFDYDGIDRLQSATGPWGAGTVAYDGAGNISNQILGGFSLYYGYDGNNRLVNLSGSKAGTYAYDVAGNVAYAPGSTYAYDQASNLICVSCASPAHRIAYAYDGLNQRVSVAKGDVKSYEMYAPHGNPLIEFVPGQANKLTEYIYLGSKRIAQRVSAQ